MPECSQGEHIYIQVTAETFRSIQSTIHWNEKERKKTNDDSLEIIQFCFGLHPTQATNLKEEII
ncbi:hypothetical protein DERF_000076 [Dermatophagoides farinae]|uniref:Uncharacterized protein n=1 Tax=Dermatophagoides farinae TaxID=6954 RepID=A0A922IC20_DERFA|nr:hypothetical protein DERF_000076 [Dermatophagoides farinae]